MVEVASGLDHPWGLAFLPDGRMLVTERAGRLRTVTSEGRLDPEPVAGVPRVHASGQGGLLDVALHPAFRENGWVYLSYAAGHWGRAGTEVASGRLRGHRLEDVEVLFRALPKSGSGRHFGSRLRFAPDGHLFITLGDRGDRHLAQDPDNHAGSIIRLRDDGGIPLDNPFVGVDGALPEIYTIGNRNVQGLAFDSKTGVLWSHEHGPRGGDELNVVRPSVNYGWPVISYGREYLTRAQVGEGTHRDGMAQPVHQWTPSIAPSGLTVYDGDRFPRLARQPPRRRAQVPARRPPRTRRRTGGARGTADRGPLRANPRRADGTGRPRLPPHRRPRAPTGALVRLEPAPAE